MLGSLLGGAESSRPQRAKRLPARVLGRTMSAAEEWSYHHQHTANQQQQRQGGEGSQQQQGVQGNEGSQQQQTAAKPSNSRPPRPPAKAGCNGGTKARKRAKRGPAECSRGELNAEGPQTATEGGDAPSLQGLPDNFQESGVWGDEGLGAQQEEEEEEAAAAEGGYSSHPSADEELGETEGNSGDDDYDDDL